MVTFEEVRENSDDEEVSTKLDQMIISIESELRRIESIQSNRNAPKNERKNGVNMIRSIIQTYSFESLATYKILAQIVKFSCRLFHDDSEHIRQETTDNIKKLLDKINGSPTVFAGLIPTLESRLGSEQINEECEELRLSQLEIIHKALKDYKQTMGSYLNEICAILFRTLQDPFHNIRLLSNEILLILISDFAFNIHQYSEQLILPLINSLNHQQSKIRSATVRSMSNLLKISDPALLRKNLAYLVQRCFDENASVRYTLFEEIHDYLGTYRDRYSFFNLLIPIYFGFFDDEDVFISTESKEKWVKLGEQFQNENELDLKEEIDYPTEQPKNYPEKAIRPNLGCRELVGRNVIGMLPALARDCGDNLNKDNRKMASCVLGHIARHAERVIHQHVPKFVEIISKGVQDNSSDVIQNHKETARWLCTLADNDLILKILLPSIQGLSLGTLSILDKFTEISTSQEDLTAVLTSLDKSTYGFYKEDRIISLIRNINRNISQKLQVCDLDHKQILNIEIFCQALISKEKKLNDDVLQNIVYKTFTTKADVLNCYGPDLVQHFEGSVKSWNINSPEYSAWAYLLQICCQEKATAAIEASSNNFEHLLVPNSENGRVRLHVLEMLFELVSNNHSIFNPILKKIISLVTKNIVYRAGRIETASRLLAISALGFLVPELDSDEQLKWYKAFEETIKSATEDDEITTRTNSLLIIGNVLHNEKIQFDYDFLHKIYVVFLQRLDDSMDTIRTLACQCLERLFKILGSLADTYDVQCYGAHVEYSMNVLFLHLDDDKTDIYSAVSKSLIALAKLAPQKVLKYAQQEGPNMKNKSRIQKVIDACSL